MLFDSSRQIQKKTLQGLVWLMVFLLPVLMGTVGSAASTITILLFLISCWLGWGAWNQTSPIEKAVCVGMIVFFFLALVSFVNADDLPKSWARLERLLRTLAFVPVFLFFKRLPINLITPLTYGMISGGFALLLAGYLTLDESRATGSYNSILFGDYAAIVSTYLIAALLFKKISPALRVSAFISLGCAFAAMVLSETRGAWVAIVITGLFLFVYFVSQTRSHRQFFIRIFGVLAVIIACGVLLYSSDRVQIRVSQAVSEFDGYRFGSDPHTSLGYRFQMWEATWKIWTKNPWIGTGLGDYSNDLAVMIRTGETKMREHFGEAHNLLFEFLATTGLLGAMSCAIALFVFPSLALWRLLKNKRQQPFIPVAGIAIIIAFFVFGLTQNWLARSSITSSYIVFIAVLLGEARKNLNCCSLRS